VATFSYKKLWQVTILAVASLDGIFLSSPLLLPVDDNDDAEASFMLLITFYSKALAFATEKMAPRFGDLFNFEKPYLLNRWAHSALQINKVY